MKLVFLYEFAANMLFFIMIGYFIDHYYEIRHSWGILSGILSGFAYALYTLFRRLKKF